MLKTLKPFKTNDMKSKQEINNQFYCPASATINFCLNYYLEMHNNGHKAIVRHLLEKGDGFCGKNGYTYQELRKRVCDVKAVPFYDYQGVYAGTNYSYFYDGSLVDQSVSYSLFN
jgi:hypothetical protein